MEVAVIEPVGGHGGMNYYDLGLAGGLSNAHCDVILYTCSETMVPDGLPFVVKTSFRGIWGRSSRLLRAVRFVYSLLSSLRDARANGIQIIHYHFFHYSVIEALCVKSAKVFGFRVVVTAHDVESFAGASSAASARKTLLCADRIIAHNKVSRQELISRISIPASSVRVVPHGNYLDSVTDLPEKAIARNALGLSPGEKVILFFGQIKKVKGLDILLWSLVAVIEKHPDLKLVIAGKVWKDDFHIYESIIRDNGLEGNVLSHIRYIPDDDVANYYRAADLVVLPYRRIYQSGVLLMAMSYKVPVLASDIPGMIEVIVDGKNGYLFASENVADLSARLIELLADTEALVATGVSGYETAVRDFDWDRIGQMTSDVYKDLDDGR